MLKKGYVIHDSFFESFNDITDYDNALGNSSSLYMYIYIYLLVHQVYLWTCNVDKGLTT